ncbi:hypothetical protein [Phytohabitans houttuyneae]|uniref:Uncharacterized protein n=1 Tax=Phytohabitans houttuyneae TaxID=1076126 RepID=A0A6V8KIN7_9ACTN|nr:hypothetical protein [Phytohabitans houttuyneae]GFJ82288.1 hypothetical protein Phou_064680 [Phytohabitans houttuyneae]
MWESILLTLTGGAVAAGAGVLTALMQARHATRLRREQREHEDRYRLYQDRVDAYIAFQTLASKARRVLQDFTDDTPEDDAERREARNAAHLAFIKVALIGGAEVVAAGRQMMITIDAVTYGREPYDSERYRTVLSGFRAAARHDLTGQDDLASIVADGDWPAPPPRPRPVRPASNTAGG